MDDTWSGAKSLFCSHLYTSVLPALIWAQSSFWSIARLAVSHLFRPSAQLLLALQQTTVTVDNLDTHAEHLLHYICPVQGSFQSFARLCGIVTNSALSILTDRKGAGSARCLSSYPTSVRGSSAGISASQEPNRTFGCPHQLSSSILK